jgi:protein gp37
MENTKIQWTDHTFNPWWGCSKVSPGCTHCYADTFAKRVGQDIWGPDAPRRFQSDSYWKEPLRWNRSAQAAGVRRRVFCASMADVFEDRRDLDSQRERLWNLIAQTPCLDWQLLTKRPENVERLVPREWLAEWPANVWLGATAENQEYADRRLPILIALPAPIRFVSCEPLLDAINLRPFLDSIQWVIVGGESGMGSRPCATEWIEDLQRQCKEARVACFVKQLGTHVISLTEGVLLKFRDSKGGQLEEWPEPLRVREFPASECDREQRVA